MLQRVPGPALRPFVERLWASDDDDVAAPALEARERVLPTGAMHVVIRIDEPLRLFESIEDTVGRTIGYAIVGGARSSFYVRDISRPSRSVGAQLRPGAAQLILGAPAEPLAERHTCLEDLWGRAATEARERLALTPSASGRLDLFEALLASRLPRVRGVHPAVASALDAFRSGSSIGDAVRESGYSHRRFITIFRDAVGLSPKLHCRVVRFQEALARLAKEPDAAAIEIAIASGYSDQPHFQRDFRELAGISPGRYRALAIEHAHHVPISESRGRKGPEQASRTFDTR